MATSTAQKDKMSRTTKKLARAPRSNNSPKNGERQTELELDLASSGRKRVHASADGLRKPRKAQAQGRQVASKEKDGSAVAPTAKAEAREKERHAREAAIGRRAGGLEGARRDQRGPGVTRKKLDEAARAADERVARG